MVRIGMADEYRRPEGYDDVDMIQVVPHEHFRSWKADRGKRLLGHDEVCLRMKGPNIVKKETDSKFGIAQGEDLIVFNTGAHDLLMQIDAVSCDGHTFRLQIDGTLCLINGDRIYNAVRLFTSSPGFDGDSDLGYSHDHITRLGLGRLVDCIAASALISVRSQFREHDAEWIANNLSIIPGLVKESMRGNIYDWDEGYALRVKIKQAEIIESCYLDQMRQIRVALDTLRVVAITRDIERQMNRLNNPDLCIDVRTFIEPILTVTKKMRRLKFIVDMDDYNRFKAENPGLDDLEDDSLPDVLQRDFGNGCTADPNVIGYLLIKEKYYDEAEKWFDKGARAGSAESAFNLGLCYESAADSRSLAKATDLFKDAAGKGCIEAQVKIGQLLRTSGRQRDRTEAREWLENASQCGSAEAKYELALLLDDGILTDEVYGLYKESAEMGFGTAQMTIGVFYLTGRFLPFSKEKGEEWLSAAAESGDSDARYLLGRFLVENGEDADLERGIKIVMKSMRSGNLDATCYLGECYERGIGVGQSFKTAFDHYKNAAFRDHPRACYDLGRFYQSGCFVNKSDRDAKEWYRKAADQGHVPSINALGEYLMSDCRVSARAECRERFQVCIEKRLPAAMFNMGRIVKEESSSGAYVANYYLPSCEAGYPPAMVEYARCKHDQIGVPRDLELSYRILKKATEFDDPEAWRLLGECYERGDGVQRSVVDAEDAYRRSASLKRRSDMMEHDGPVDVFWSCFEHDPRLTRLRFENPYNYIWTMRPRC